MRPRWSAPTGPEVVTDYDVNYRLAGTDAWSEWRPEDVSLRLSATITGLTNGVRYEVVVWAHNEHAGSPYSRPMFGTPQQRSTQQSTREISPTFHGPSAHTWFTNSHDSRYRYTCPTDDPPNMLAWAVWSWDDTPSGNYRIQVYVPPLEATAIVAYRIGSGSTGLIGDPVRLNQFEHRGTWATIAEGHYAGGRLWVELGDKLSDPGGPDNSWCTRRWGGDRSIGAANARLVRLSGDGHTPTATIPTPEGRDGRGWVANPTGAVESKVTWPHG